MKNRKLRNDIFLIAAILCLIILGFAFLTPKNTGKFAAVIIDGTETARYPLNEDLEIDIKTSGVNHLVIKDGAATISSADCKTQVCVKTGSIKNAGETIVCLPHNLIIEIISE